MKATVNAKTCCDAECASANGCTVGGVSCGVCGLYFCADDIGENGLCAECERELENEQPEE